MRIIKCDQCKREIEEPVITEGFEFDTDEGKLLLSLKDGRELCEPCRNRIIRKVVKENFPLE